MDTLHYITWFSFFKCLSALKFLCLWKCFSGVGLFLVSSAQVPCPPPAHLERCKCVLLPWGTGAFPSAVIVDLPQFQSVINRYYFAAQQQLREIAGPTETLFSTYKPNWWPSAVTDVREWQAPWGTLKVLMGKKASYQITKCILTNHIKVEKKPEQKKITTFIFFLIFCSDTVCVLPYAILSAPALMSSSAAWNDEAFTVLAEGLCCRKNWRLGRTYIPRNTLGNFFTLAYVG